MEITSYNYDKVSGIFPNAYMVLILPATDYILNLISAKEKIMEEVKCYNLHKYYILLEKLAAQGLDRYALC